MRSGFRGRYTPAIAGEWPQETGHGHGNDHIALREGEEVQFLGLTVHYALKGMVKETIAAGLKANELGGTGIAGIALARAYTLAGDASKARDTLNTIVKRAKEMYVAGAWAPALRRLAMAYAELGEKDKAFECLDLWYQRRHPNIFGLRVEPFLDNLHSDPRFTALLKKVGLEK